MKRTLLLITLVFLMASPALGLNPPEDPLTLFPQPKENELLLYIEFENMPFWVNILEGKWVNDFMTNLGKVKKEELVAFHLFTGTLRSFVKEASIMIYSEAENLTSLDTKRVLEKGRPFLILYTKQNPMSIAKALNINFKKEGKIYKFELEKGRKSYALMGENYVILAKKRDLERLLNPFRTKLAKAWNLKSTSPIPTGSKGELYIFVKLPESGNINQESVEVFGRSEEKAFVLETLVKERKDSSATITPRPLYSPIPGKGKPLLLTALPIDGKALLDLLKKNLSQDATTGILFSLSLTEEEFIKLLTGRLYFIIGGEAKVLGLPIKGLYLYFISDLPNEELSPLFKRVMNVAMRNYSLEKTLKINEQSGWDILYRSEPSTDLIIGLKGQDIFIGVTSIENLNHKMEIPEQVEKLFMEANLPFLYLNIKELRAGLESLEPLIKSLSGEEEAKEFNKVKYVIPPWQEIIARSFNQKRGEIRIIYQDED
ncbi:MAG: hypothetical protein H5T91_00070 [Synergistetes bacterium]|nr:hypothetical protein [Synergistota bacterium]